MKKRIDCSICGKLISPEGDWELGHNARPVNDGRCCDDCNESVVMPLRIMLIQKRNGNARN